MNAAVAAAAAIAGVLTGVIAMLAFRWSERDLKRPTRTSLHTDPVLPPGVDTVLSVLRSSAVVLDEADGVVKASSAAYALGLVRGGKLAVEPMLQMARDTRRKHRVRVQGGARGALLLPLAPAERQHRDDAGAQTGDRCCCGDRRVHVHASRLGMARAVPTAVGVRARTLVAQSSPWSQYWFIWGGGNGRVETGWWGVGFARPVQRVDHTVGLA